MKDKNPTAPSIKIARANSTYDLREFIRIYDLNSHEANEIFFSFGPSKARLDAKMEQLVIIEKGRALHIRPQ